MFKGKKEEGGPTTPELRPSSQSLDKGGNDPVSPVGGPRMKSSNSVERHNTLGFDLNPKTNLDELEEEEDIDDDEPHDLSCAFFMGVGPHNIPLPIARIYCTVRPPHLFSPHKQHRDTPSPSNWLQKIGRETF